MKRALVCLLVFLPACISPGTREADRYFILDAPPGRTAAVALRVAPTTAAGFYDTQSIVYSRAPGTRAYYQFNHWTEHPQRAVHKALAARFNPGERFLLQAHLEEIYHEAAQRPGTGRITLTVELLDARTRKLIARRTFQRSAPAASYDAPGAVQALRQALGELLDEVVSWVEAEAKG